MNLQNRTRNEQISIHLIKEHSVILSTSFVIFIQIIFNASQTSSNVSQHHNITAKPQVMRYNITANPQVMRDNITSKPQIMRYNFTANLQVIRHNITAKPQVLRYNIQLILK